MKNYNNKVKIIYRQLSTWSPSQQEVESHTPIRNPVPINEMTVPRAKSTVKKQKESRKSIGFFEKSYYGKGVGVEGMVHMVGWNTYMRKW